ncbi:hypothetical protein AO284_24020, partial [Pseudomonas sp. NZIPFR-PS2]
ATAHVDDAVFWALLVEASDIVFVQERVKRSIKKLGLTHEGDSCWIYDAIIVPLLLDRAP